MLSEPSVKRHLIILPPPKKKKKIVIFFFLGGGGKFFWIKSSIFESGRDKKFWQDFGAERTLSIIGQYRTKTHN